MSWSQEWVCRAPNGDVVATATEDVGCRWRIAMEPRRVLEWRQVQELAELVQQEAAKRGMVKREL